MTASYPGAMDTRPAGLVLARTPRLFGIEPFYMELLGGIEGALAEVDRAVMLQVVPDSAAELATYRRWAADQAVAAVVVVNLVQDDPRIGLLGSLGLPAAALAPASVPLPVATVTVDGASAMREAVRELVALGHHRIARVSGPSALVHTLERDEAYAQACAEAGVEPVVAVADYTEETGAQAAAELLAREPRPTALVFDNDVMAVAGARVAKERGLDVPGDVSILAWDDSALCRLASPPLSAMSFDVDALGRQVGAVVLELLEHGHADDRAAVEHRFLARGSTGPAPA